MGTPQQSGRPIPQVGLRVLAVALAISACLLLSACTSNESYKNENKPPATLTVSVIVGASKIEASPVPFGAGPARFVIANQSGEKQVVTLSTDEFDRDVIVDQNQTANFKQTVEPGFLSISADNSAAQSLEITVGPERESAQQDLGQP